MSNVEELVNLLKSSNMTVTTAESCTGGLLASMIVDIPGASYVFNEGHITYANEAKMKYLGVREDILKEKGAVSEETAYMMAEGAAKLAHADMAFGITGVAGPDGGTKEKPVGLVYISCYFKGDVKVTKNIFKGSRTEVRMASANRAIELGIEMIK